MLDHSLAQVTLAGAIPSLPPTTATSSTVNDDMEVLSGYPATPTTPRPLYQSSIFDRRSKAGPETQRTYRHLSLSIRQDQDLDGVTDQGGLSPLGKEPSRSGRRPTTCGFLPLPSISASPICTPTTSSSSRHMFGDDFPGSSSGTDDYITAPPTPSDNGSSKSHLAPTWISIPPTPPPKLFRRSVTCVARLPHSTAVSPSASFPASGVPHADPLIISQPAFKRRASVPSMSSHPPIRSASDSATALVRRRKSKNNAEAIVAASPLRTSFRSRPPSAFHNRAHPMFSISHEVNSDHEDNGDGSGSMDGSVEASSSDQNHASELWHVEKCKDDIRKYHALMELLSTEVRYLMDLRVLVMVRSALPALRSKLITSFRFTYDSCPPSRVGRHQALLSLEHPPLLRFLGPTPTRIFKPP